MLLSISASILLTYKITNRAIKNTNVSTISTMYTVFIIVTCRLRCELFILKMNQKNIPAIIVSDSESTTEGSVTVGIDIGEMNMAITIISDTNEIVNNYHYNVTRGYSTRSLGRCIHGIIYDMLDEVVLQHYSAENTTIKIEDQLCTNRVCSTLQAIIHTIFYMKKYKVEVINARRKYASLKYLLGSVPSKKNLSKYIELDQSKFIFRQYNIKEGIFENRPDSPPLPTVALAERGRPSGKESRTTRIKIKEKPIKYDDIIDSYLIASYISLDASGVRGGKVA